MTDKDRIEAVVRSAYAARKEGDLDAIMRHFADGAHFSLAGSTNASSVPLMARGNAAIRGALEQLIASFEFRDVELLDIIVDPPKAAVHWRVHVRSAATGEEVVTEMVDILRVEGERIASFTQFADTALAARLIGK